MNKTITFNYASGEARCKTRIDMNGCVQMDACDYLLATVETPDEDYELYAETSDYLDVERALDDLSHIGFKTEDDMTEGELERYEELKDDPVVMALHKEGTVLTEEGDKMRLAQLIEAIKEQIDALPITGFTFSFPDGSEYTPKCYKIIPAYLDRFGSVADETTIICAAELTRLAREWKGDDQSTEECKAELLEMLEEV